MKNVTDEMLAAIHDDTGNIIPTQEAFEKVKREYPNRTGPELYRLAQAQVLLDLFQTKSASR